MIDLVFDAPEGLAATLQGFEADLMVTRGHGEGWITRTLVAPGIRLQLGYLGAPYVLSAVTWPHSAQITVPLRSVGWRVDGMAFDDAILLATPGSFHTAATTSPVALASISIDWQEYLLAWQRVLGPGQPPPGAVLPMTAHLRRKLYRLIHQFEHELSAPLPAETPSAFVAQWKADLFSALSTAARKTTRNVQRPYNSSGRIIQTGLRYLMHYPTKAVSITELCTATSASERALRAAFGRTFLMGPVEYARLRRLHLVHRLLRCPALSGLTITEAATRFGFHDLGRFAWHYCRVFGEKPSATLRHRVFRQHQ